MHKNFEEFLQYKFTTEMFPEILDDDLPDRFNDYEWDTEELIKYADEYRNYTVEKLIEEIPNHAEGFGEYCDTGEDMGWQCRSECTEEAVKRLRAKWLGKENYGHN